MNIAVLIGTGYFGEDIFHKLPWVRHMDQDYKVFVASRIDPEIHLSRPIEYIFEAKDLDLLETSLNELGSMAKLEFIYRSPFFRKSYSEDEVLNIQEWLGVSFNYISSFDRRFYDYDKISDSRDTAKVFNYIASLVSYFKDFFETNNIDCFINTLEDDAFSVVAYFVAKKLNIRVLGLMRSRFPRDGLIFCDDYKHICTWNSKTEISWEDIDKIFKEKRFLGEKNIEKTRSDLHFLSLPKKLRCIPWIFVYNKLLKNIREVYPYEMLIMPKMSLFDSSRNLIRRFLRKTFITGLISKDVDDRYFVFPLHYMEDAQLTFREPLTDQFKLIKDISRALPTGYYLYVKPHPHYLGSDVSLRKIRYLSKIHNIKIIDPLTPIIDLISNAAGVITINSSTGFEALIKGVPVLSFGHEFYSKEDLCYIVRDLNILSETLLEMLHTQKNRRLIQDFIKRVYNNTIWIKSYSNDFVPFGITNEDGVKISEALKIILGGS